MITGDIHEELQATNDRTPQEAMNDLTDVLCGALDTMASKFGRVLCLAWLVIMAALAASRVSRVVSTPAMSGRSTATSRALQKIKPSTSMCRMENRCVLLVFGHGYLLTHGDSLGVKGGDGIIGAMGPIMRGAIKTGRSKAQVGRDFDVLVMGHWHQYLTFPGVIVNNALIGYNEFARLTSGPFNDPAKLSGSPTLSMESPPTGKSTLKTARSSARKSLGEWQAYGGPVGETTFEAPPTCATFMKDAAFGRIVAGPVGSGKTTACLMELFRRSVGQAPAADGYATRVTL